MIPVGWLVGWRVWCKFERPNDMILGVNMEMIWRHYDFPYFFYYIPSVRLQNPVIGIQFFIRACVCDTILDDYSWSLFPIEKKVTAKK